MNRPRHHIEPPQRVRLGGADYVIVRQDLFDRLAAAAGWAEPGVAGAGARDPRGGRGALPPELLQEPGLSPLHADARALARRLIERRRRAGITQADLARRAGIRPETLNRIERGRTTPDFATIRKLVVAMDAAEVAARR